MSSSTAKGDQKRVISELSGTAMHPKDGKETFEVATAVARAAVHTPTAFEGPDALLLCSTDGLPEEGESGRLTPQDFSFYQAIPISGTSGDPQSVVREGNTLKLLFTPEENEGSLDGPATEAKNRLKDMQFALFWAPTGDPNEERVAIAEGVDGEKAWAEHSVSRFIAHFVATKFAEACEAALPGETPPSYDPDDPIRTEAPALDFLTEDDDEDEAFRVAEPVWASATPVESRPASDETKRESGSFERPPGPRWVHLIQITDPFADDVDAGDEMDSEVLGAYRVTEQGTYKRARFNDEGTLEVVGDAQAQVPVPIDGGAFSTTRHVTYARLSGFKVPVGRLQDLGERIAGQKRTRDQQAGLMPLRVTAATLTDGMAGGGWGRHATNYDAVFAGEAPEQEGIEAPLTEEPFWTLPHPLSIAERRVGWAEQAYDRLQAWNETVEGTPALTGPMKSTCHDPDQHRTYLAERLLPAEQEAHDMTADTHWGRFSHEAVPEAPRGESALAHFQYGARCQTAYLRLQWRRATQAFDRLVEGGLLTHDVVLDALASERKKKGETKQVERLFAYFPRIQAVGGGTALPSMMRDSDLFKEMADVPVDQGEKMAEPLDAAMEQPLKDSVRALINESGFKLLFKLARQSTTTAQHLFAQGTATGAVSWSASATLVESYADAPPKAFLAWGWLLQRVTDESRSPSAAYDVASGSAERAGAHGRIAIGATKFIPADGSNRVVPWKIAVELDMSAAAERWTGQSTSARVASAPLGKASAAAGGALSALDVLLGTYTLWADPQDGPLGVVNGARAARVLTGVAGTIEAGTQVSGSVKAMVTTLSSSGVRTVGRFLSRTLPFYLEAVQMGIDTWDQYNDVDHRGLQTVSDPNYVGTVGAVVRGTGGMLAVGAGAAGAWPLVAVGAAVYAGGQVLVWTAENLDEIDQELNDPLTDWLPDGTLWGEDAEADRTPLFQLVRPGSPDDKKALSEYTAREHGTARKRLQAELDGFAEKGFSFPTAGHAAPPTRAEQVHAQDAATPPRYRQRPAALDNPTLRIVPRYLPAEGTLLVNAEVDSQFAPEPARVRCAVHYVSIGGNFRYKVMPVGDTRKAHPLQVDERQSLKQAVDSSWGESTEREVVLPVKDREVEHRMETNRRGKRVMRPRKKVTETKTPLQQDVMELTLVDEPIPSAPESSPEKPPAAVLRPEDVFGRRASEPVSPDATATGPERPAPAPQTVPVPGLDEVLQNQAEATLAVGEGEEAQRVYYEGPRFEITGGVYFRVDQPVDPSPQLPKGTGPQSPDEKLPDYMAAMDIEYAYPGDALAM